MDTFKQIMGFTLVATTIWLVDVLGAQTGIEGTTGFSDLPPFCFLSAWIFGKWGSVWKQASVSCRCLDLLTHLWGLWIFSS